MFGDPWDPDQRRYYRDERLDVCSRPGEAFTPDEVVEVCLQVPNDRFIHHEHVGPFTLRLVWRMHKMLSVEFWRMGICNDRIIIPKNLHLSGKLYTFSEYIPKGHDLLEKNRNFDVLRHLTDDLHGAIYRR